MKTTGGKEGLNRSTIQHKVVVMMGASSGIGEATTKKLAEEGAKLVIAAHAKWLD